MYSKWPYPSCLVGQELIYDLASMFQFLLPEETLSGAEILDVGCGTGQRLVAFASRFPAARFTGIDVTEQSLALSRRLCVEHGVTNVRLLCRDLSDFDAFGAFDIVTSTGVLHHLENPAAGLARLCRLLKPDGILSVWVYHAIGEFRRLNSRELLRTLWTDESDYASGLAAMRDLDLSLDPYQYGSSAAQRNGHVDEEAIDVDAFMHPIVRAYRFTQFLAMFVGCPVQWMAVNGINRPGASHLVDLDDVEAPLRSLCVPMKTWLKTPALMASYQRLCKADKLRVLELLTEPTGFTVLAGRGSSLSRLGPRVQGNSMPVPC